MKTRLILKIAIIFMVVLLEITSFNCTYASSGGAVSDFIDSMDESKPSGGTSIMQFMGTLLGIVQAVAAVAAVVVLAIIGIKYIAASVDEKASIKKQAIVYFIGTVLVFSGATIVRFLAQIAEGW